MIAESAAPQENPIPASQKMTIEEALPMLALITDGTDAELCDIYIRMTGEGQKLKPHARHSAYKIAERHAEELRRHGIEVESVPYISDLVKTDPANLQDPDIKSWFRWLKEHDELEYEIAIKKAKINANMRTALEKKLGKATEEHASSDSDGTTNYPAHIREKARGKLDCGEALDFMMEQYHRFHHGDDELGKTGFCSKASAQSLTNHGIQIDVHSDEPGQGKSDAVEAIFHCVHARRDLQSVSPKVLFRDKSIRAGDIINADDSEYTPGYTATVKRSMTNFQKETHYRTLDSNGKPFLGKLPPRLLWWSTSIEPSSSKELRDRQTMLDVSSDQDHHEKVNDFMLEKRMRGDLPYGVDDDVLISRCITLLIEEDGPFRINIPQDLKERMRWNGEATQHRDYNRFLDYVDALAILNYPQRSHKKADGYTWLTVSAEDVDEAERILGLRDKNIRTHLTNSEWKLLESMCKSIPENALGWTQAELADTMGLDQSTISKRLGKMLSTPYVTVTGTKGDYHYLVTRKGKEEYNDHKKKEEGTTKSEKTEKPLDNYQ